MKYVFLLYLMMVLFSRAGIADACSIEVSVHVPSEPLWGDLEEVSVSGVFNEPVQLHYGQYQGPPYVSDGQSRPELFLWPELLINGDIDAVDGQEYVALLSETTGGSAERVYLLALTVTSGTTKTWPAVLLGDRVKIRSITIHNQQIMVDLIEPDLGEALCCGTQITRQIWQLDEDHLVKIEHQLQGRLSTTILQDKSWYLLEKSGDRPDAVHPSCMKLIIDGSKIIGNISGRSFIATFNETSPGWITITDMISILEEDNSTLSPPLKLLSHLSSIDQYTFRAGRLLLIGQDKQRQFMLEFAEGGNNLN